MSNFDPATFLNATVNAPSEKADPLPEGDYIGVCGAPEVRVTQGRKDPTKTYMFVDIPVTLEVPVELQSSLGLPPTRRVTHSFGLDVTDQGTLDNSKGKNNGMRLLREALDMNKPGDAFSLATVEGRPIRVALKHELYNEQIQERVKGVARV
jgi:hypothetical protein